MMGVLLGLSACASTSPVSRAPYDFSKIRRITVMPFEGTGGPAASDEFVREIVGTGLAVSDARHPGDVILRGTVTEYKSNTSLMVFLGNTTLVSLSGQAVVVDNPVVAPGPAGTPEGISPEAHHAQVVSVIATVGLDVVLLDASTKTLLWRGSQSYEGLELPGTLQTVVRSLTHSLSAVLPGMHRKLS